MTLERIDYKIGTINVLKTVINNTNETGLKDMVILECAKNHDDFNRVIMNVNK